MPGVTIAAAAESGLHLGLLAAAFGFGLRHGFDWDHIAAITDITGSTKNGRRSMRFAALYALGHGLVVLVLGILAIVAGGLISPRVDAAMGRVVGFTLVALGLYVLYALFRDGRDFRMQSRWMLVFGAARRAVRWLRSHGEDRVVVIEHDHDHDHGIDPHGHDHGNRPKPEPQAGSPVAVATKHRHTHRHAAPMPEDPFKEYGATASFAVGMIHGVGAETPTQVVLFVTAAGVGGTAAGALLLGAFVAGLLVSNTLVALASTYGFLRAGQSFPIYAAAAVVTAFFSLAFGGLLLAGRGEALPAIFAG